AAAREGVAPVRREGHGVDILPAAPLLAEAADQATGGDVPQPHELAPHFGRQGATAVGREGYGGGVPTVSAEAPDHLTGAKIPQAEEEAGGGVTILGTGREGETAIGGQGSRLGGPPAPPKRTEQIPSSRFP